jgi:hypothetical protein
MRRAPAAAELAGADAGRRALALLQPPPPVLSEEPPMGLDPGPARAAWLNWAGAPDVGGVSAAAGLRDRADHLDQVLPPLAREGVLDRSIDVLVEQIWPARAGHCLHSRRPGEVMG